MRRGFTLVEVSVAAGMIGVVCLIALAAIPSSLKLLDVSRMRAVGAAVATYLVSRANDPYSGEYGSTKSRIVTAHLTPIPAIDGIIDDLGTPISSDAQYYYLKDSLAPDPGTVDLSRRIGVSFPASSGGIQSLRIWMLMKDPQNRPSLRLLSTYTVRDGI